MSVYKELLNRVKGLNVAGVEYALCGGLAVVVYGYALDCRKMKDTTRRKRPKANMSPEAIAQRLRDWSQLFELCMSLKRVKPLGKTRDIKAQQKPATSET